MLFNNNILTPFYICVYVSIFANSVESTINVFIYSELKFIIFSLRYVDGSQNT